PANGAQTPGGAPTGSAPSTSGPTGPASGNGAKGASALTDAVKNGQIIGHGQHGPAVQELQEKLRGLGYDLQKDGRFGPQTENALRQSQRDHGLKDDGLFGARSLAALEKASPSQATGGAEQTHGPKSTAPRSTAPDTTAPKSPAPKDAAIPASPKDPAPASTKNSGASAPVDTTSGPKPNPSLDWGKAGDDIRSQMGVKPPNENLSPQQVDQALTLAAQKYGVSKELLVHTMKSESGGNQKDDNGAAHGLMQ